MSALEQEVRRLRENIQILSGERGDSTKTAAARKADLKALADNITLLVTKTSGISSDIDDLTMGYTTVSDALRALSSEYVQKIAEIDAAAAVLAEQVQNDILHLATTNFALLNETRQRATDIADAALANATTMVEVARVEADDRATGYRATVALRDEAAGMRATLIEQITAVHDGVVAQITDLSDAMASADEAMATRITTVEATLPNKADASVVDSLSATVTQQGSDITAQAQAITGVQTTLGTKADASAVTTLAGRVSQTETGLQATSSAVTSIQAVLPNKAEATALNSLSATVTQQGNSITAQGQTITGIQASLNGKVEASAYNAFTVSVNNTLGSHASWISGVEATSNSGTATGRMFWDVQSGPAGLGAVFRLVVATNATNWSGGGSEAGFYINAASGNFVITANKTVIMSPSGTVAAFFDASGKVGKAYIPSITADMITTGTLIASSAQIGNLVVATSNIADQAVVERYPSIVNSIAFHNVGWQTIATVGISAPGDYGALITVSMICAFTSSGIIATQYALDIDGTNDVTEQLSWTDPSARFNYTAIKIRGAGSMTVSVRFYAGSAGNYQRLVELNVMRIKK